MLILKLYFFDFYNICYFKFEDEIKIFILIKVKFGLEDKYYLKKKKIIISKEKKIF